MSVLAFKALDYGAEKIPDKLFEKIPGGFFSSSADRKRIEKKRHPEREPRNKSEQRRGDRDRRRPARPRERERSPASGDYSDSDSHSHSDYERDVRRKDRRRRARSLGHSISRSLSRGRHHSRSAGRDAEYDMDRAERAERGAQFDPPPGSEYRPYNPQEYAAPPPAAGPSAGNGYHDPYDQRAYSARPDYGLPPQPPSQTAARYTPASGYAPSPVNASNPPPSQAYAPYNPADYASPGQDFRAPGNTYPSPPPIYRQRSLSQSSVPQAYPESQYLDSRNQVAPYVAPSVIPPGRHGSTASAHRRRHGDGKHHRARSAGHHGRSREDSVTDKVRDRFENLDMHDKNLAASVGGAGIGAIGGREMEKRIEKTKASREGSRAPRDARTKNRSQASSRDRRRGSRYDDRDRDYEYDSSSDSDSADRRRHSRRRRD